MDSKECRPVVLFTDFGDDLHQVEVIASIHRMHLKTTSRMANILQPVVGDVAKFSIPNGAYQCRQLVRSWEFIKPVVTGVVDPTVGSEREAIAADLKNGTTLVGPNNGIFSLAIQQFGVKCAVVLDEEIRLQPRNATTTFDGRDLFAPAAALVASGESTENLGKEFDVQKLLNLEIENGTVLHADDYGNLKIHGAEDQYERGNGAVPFTIRKTRYNPKKVRSHNEASEGDLVILPGSSGMIEIWIVEGNARKLIGATVGDIIEFIE
ncbi:MAG: SAM-dependent chlorinase/fluorinase [bacterium]|nr:SAM-dependent chlorinase/fluorinase [bacterium]